MPDRTGVNFERVPHGLSDLLIEGVIDHATYALVVYVASRINHVSGKYVTTMADLQRDLGFGKDRRYTSRRLAQARDLALLDYDDPVRGPGSRYVIRLGTAWEQALETGELVPNQSAVSPEGLRTVDKLKSAGTSSRTSSGGGRKTPEAPVESGTETPPWPPLDEDRGQARGRATRRRRKTKTPLQTDTDKKAPRPKRGKRQKHITEALRIPYEEWIEDQTSSSLKHWQQLGYDTSPPQGGER